MAAACGWVPGRDMEAGTVNVTAVFEPLSEPLSRPPQVSQGDRIRPPEPTWNVWAAVLRIRYAVPIRRSSARFVLRSDPSPTSMTSFDPRFAAPNEASPDEAGARPRPDRGYRSHSASSASAEIRSAQSNSARISSVTG